MRFPRLMIYYQGNKKDRLLGVLFDWRHGSLPTLVVGFWFFGVMFY